MPARPVAKYNFVGVAARLWLPTGPAYGFIEVSVDGIPSANISLYAPTPTRSSVVWQWAGPALSAGNTATRQQQHGDGRGGGGVSSETPSVTDTNNNTHAHAVTLRWLPTPSLPSTSAGPDLAASSRQHGDDDGSRNSSVVDEHPPFIKWVNAPGYSAVFDVPQKGLPNVPVLSTNVTTAAECQALCEQHTDCTMFTGPTNYTGPTGPNQQHCWCSNCSWCTICFGRTDSVWDLHSVPGSFSARRIKVQPPPPPPPPPAGQGQMFPVDVLEFLPVAALDADQPPMGVTVSNVIPKVDVDGNIVNCHDGALVQDGPSGVFYLYGIGFSPKCTSAMYDNCVLGGPCGSDFAWNAYRSHNLLDWTVAAGNIQPTNAPNGGDQSRVLRNPRTGKYFFIRRGPIGQTTSLLIAVGNGPIGPFVELPPLDTGGDVVGSQAGFHVDDQGRGYAWYDTRAPGVLPFGRQCVVELSPDFTKSTGKKSCWNPRDGFGLEGGALWDRDGTYYFAAGSPCCNCALGGDGRVWTTAGPNGCMGAYNYSSDINPTVQPRPPLPPGWPHHHMAPPAFDSSNATAATSACNLEGSWVGSVYLHEGGQPLRGGLRVTKLPDGRYNFSETQPHNSMISGVGNVTDYGNGTAKIVIIGSRTVDGVITDVLTTGFAAAWPGLDVGCTMINWGVTKPGLPFGQVTWGKQPQIPETRFQVSSQMFGVSTIRPMVNSNICDDDSAVYMYTGERYQTGPDGLFAHGFMYWQPLTFDQLGVAQTLKWTDNFTLPLLN